MNKPTTNDQKDAKYWIRTVLLILLDILPFPNLILYFDKNQDGKVNIRDLKLLKWWEILIAFLFTFLVWYSGAFSPEQIVNFLKTLFL